MAKEFFERFPKILIFPLLLFLLILILAAFKVSGSSVGMYNKYFYGEAYKDHDLLFGKPRPIRSDEWVVETPLSLAQTKVNFAEKNALVGLGESIPVLSSAPTKNWTTIFRPQNWSYFLMPVENAFAFKWWFRGFILIVGCYFLVLALSNGSYLIAIFSSLIFFFSPFVQWWYSTTEVEMLGFFFFSLYFFTKAFEYKDKKNFSLHLVFLVYSLIAFLVLLYPPFQIPLILLGLFLGLGYVLNRLDLLTKKHLLPYLLGGGFLIVALGIFLLLFYWNFKDIITIVSNTAYPGKRISLGGQFSLLRLFSGFYDILLLRSRSLPLELSNQSEASSFFLVSLFALPIGIFQFLKSFLKKEKLDFVLLAFLAFFIFILTWIVFGLPSSIAKITLLDRSTPSRSIIALGAANILFLAYFLTKLKIPKGFDYKVFAFFLAAIAFAVNFYFGWLVKTNYPYFFHRTILILAVSLISFVAVYLILLKKTKIALGFLLLFSIASTLLVNPLYVGLKPILGSLLSKEVQTIQKTNPSAVWAPYDNIILGDYLRANGIKSLGGVYLYPQKQFWEIFDKDNHYQDIWNRYSHVVFTTKDNTDSPPEFDLKQPDVFVIKINPCDQLLKSLNVKYFVFNSSQNFSCLKFDNEVNFPSLPMFIYERVS